MVGAVARWLYRLSHPRSRSNVSTANASRMRQPHAEADRLAGLDRDYHRPDLFNAI
jgi:hypothetical protein